MQSKKPLSLTELLDLDPQMSVPEFPRLSEDFIRLFDTQSSLLLFGPAPPVAFGGKAVGAVFPQLLPALDGRNSLEEIGRRIPDLPLAHLKQAISVMFMKGVIEDGRSEDALDAAHRRDFRHQLQFYSRYLDVTRIFGKRAAVLAKLRASRVLLITNAPAAATLIADLGEFGVGCLDLVSAEAVQPSLLADVPATLQVACAGSDAASYLQHANPRDLQAFDLICLVLEEHDPALVNLLNRTTRHLSNRVAYAVLGPRRVQLGPVVERPFTACFACADRVEDEAGRQFSDSEIEYAARLWSLSCLNLLTKLAPITSIDRIQILSRESLEMRSIPLYRQPSCEECGRGRDEHSDSTAWLDTGSSLLHSLSWFYNENTNFKSHHMIPKGHQAHYDEKNTRAVAGAMKKIHNAEVIAIAQAPAVPSGLGAPYGGGYEIEAADEGATLAQRINILMTIAGTRRMESITDGVNVGFRVAPSGGAMASQNLYLVNLGMPELAPGAFYFSPEGQLLRIRTEAVAIDDLALLERPSADGDIPVAAIVVTESYARVESKYLGISYRYTLSDAGAMLATLMAIAPRLGLGIRHSANFYDDTLSAMLGCQGVTEYAAVVCIIHDVRDGQATRVEDSSDATR